MASKVPNWRARIGALAQVVDALDARDRRDENDWNLDAAWSHVDYVAKLEDALETMHFAPSGSHGLHAAVVTVYGDIAPLIAQALAALNDPREYTLRDVLSRVVSDDCVVSFNYDTLGESLLIELLNRGSGPKLVQAPHVQLTGAIQFAKPHGSVMWNRYKRDAIDETPSVKKAMQQAYRARNAKTAKRLLTNLLQRLRGQHPGAAGSLEDGKAPGNRARECVVELTACQVISRHSLQLPLCVDNLLG